MTIKPFKLERFYTVHEFIAKYPLSSSDCEAMTTGDLLSLENGATEKFHNHWLGYTETKGNPELRNEIAKIYTNISHEDLLVCSGAQEPIFLFSQAVLLTDDDVVVQFPCYQSVHSIPESLGCKVSNWTVKYQNGVPTFDIDDLKKLITPKTKVIYLNTPHNPTGFHFTEAEQKEIVELARQRGIIIFCDEVYRELEHKPEFLIPAFADIYENGVSLGVMSKSYGLPGLRIGWVTSKNKTILEKMAILKEYTTICNSSPSEFLAIVALRNRQIILQRNLKIVETNLPLLDKFIKKYSNLFSWHKPIAGPIGFVKMNWEEDDLAFAERVVKQKNVLLLPGEIYDYRGYFRVGFIRKGMPEALNMFEEFVVENLMK